MWLLGGRGSGMQPLRAFSDIRMSPHRPMRHPMLPASHPFIPWLVWQILFPNCSFSLWHPNKRSPAPKMPLMRRMCSWLYSPSLWLAQWVWFLNYRGRRVQPESEAAMDNFCSKKAEKLLHFKFLMMSLSTYHPFNDLSRTFLNCDWQILQFRILQRRNRYLQWEILDCSQVASMPLAYNPIMIRFHLVILFVTSTG